MSEKGYSMLPDFAKKILTSFSIPAQLGWEGEQILPDRTPPGGLGIFKKRLCRMDAGSGQMVYVYFHSPTCPRDFPGT